MFGSHATTTPEPTDHESAASGSRNTSLVVIGVVLALVVSGWFVVSLFGDDSSSAAECTDADVTTVSMTVAPAMADLVDEAVEALGESTQCIELEVTTGTVAEVAAAQDEVDEGEEDVLPDLWVPDSPAWQLVLKDAGLTGRRIESALASTPVGLAGGTTGRAPATWLTALSSPRLVKTDPLASGAFAQTLLAPIAEAAERGGDLDAAEGAIVPIAQKFGAKVAAGRSRPVTIDSIPAGSKRLIPVTERDFLIALRGNPTLTWTTPATGAAVLDFPLVQPDAGDGGIGVGSGALDVAGRTGERIAAWFASDEGIAAIAGDKLRGPDGAPLPNDESVAGAEQLPDIERSQTDTILGTWTQLTVPSSILAVIDVSAPMTQSVGSLTRLGVSTNAALTALGVLPDHARIGMWGFSSNLGGAGQDWREVAPFRRLDAPVGQGRTQSDVLAVVAPSLVSMSGGNTGLYDTVLAAYSYATREYNPAYSNSIAVFTAGVNNDPGSITLDELVAQLDGLYDPDRPVRLVPIGIGQDADLGALQRIAGATNGQAFEADTPEDILTVLASSLLSR